MLNLLFNIFIIIVFLVILFLIFWKFWFLRDPERKIPEGNVVVAPADGKVIDILDIKNPDEIKIKKGLVGKIRTLTTDVTNPHYLISIFMSPLDVHINRAPVEGEVVSIKYEKGKLLPANSLENGLLNEKNEIIIKNPKLGKIKVIQIAGILARRIVCSVEKNQNIIKGQRIGLINLGSQVTLILPKVNLAVKKGVHVTAGETVIAEF